MTEATLIQRSVEAEQLSADPNDRDIEIFARLSVEHKQLEAAVRDYGLWSPHAEHAKRHLLESYNTLESEMSLEALEIISGEDDTGYNTIIKAFVNGDIESSDVALFGLQAVYRERIQPVLQRCGDIQVERGLWPVKPGVKS